MPAMQTKIYEGDVDRFRHYETRATAWQLERIHLQNQITRQRMKDDQRKKQAAEAAKQRRLKLEKNWKLNQEIADAFSNELQPKLGVNEQSERNADDLVARTISGADARILVKNTEGEGMLTGGAKSPRHMATRGLIHQGKVQHVLDTRACIESREKAADDLAQSQGDAKWKIGMQRGAKEVELEKAEEAQFRRHAVRGFRWAKEDEASERQLDAAAGTARKIGSRDPSTRLPTSPVKGGHAMSPGTWRVETQNMAPGAWRNSQLDSQVNQAKEADRLAKDRLVAEAKRRQTLNTRFIENWSNAQLNVRDARYRAWRLKVDAAHPPKTWGSLHASTHRVSRPASPSERRPLYESPRPSRSAAGSPRPHSASRYPHGYVPPSRPQSARAA